MSSNSSITGLQELNRKFKQLADGVGGPIRDQALTEAGEYLRQDAHDKCPAKGLGSIDGHYPAIGESTARSGAVRESIKAEASQGGEVRVGTNHMLGPDLEFGTSRESPHPFMRRAADDPGTRRGLADIYRDVVSRLIEGVAR